MKEKKILKLTLEGMAFGGEAVASYQGKKIFLPWGVEGDVVNAEIVEQKRDYSRARILEVIEKSPHRAQAPCPYFLQCGGCQWQNIKYESQLAFKQKLLKFALQRTAKIQDPVLLEPIAAPEPFHYRGKIRLQISPQGKVGFYKEHSKQLIEIESCAIAEESLNQKIPQAKVLAQQFFSRGDPKAHEIELFQKGDKVKLVVDGEESVFAQANQAQNEILKKKVLEYMDLSGKEKVLELFAGDGNFTFHLAPHVSHITAVESNEAAVVSAEEKTARHHSKNIEWVESTLHRYLSSGLKGEKFDRILLDPPRMGLIQGLEALAALKVPRIVYVSCDPATLSRDVKELCERGYHHEFSQIIDMFPQTYHIESIHLLTLRSE